jgi:hypothetical protein
VLQGIVDCRKKTPNLTYHPEECLHGHQQGSSLKHQLLLHASRQTAVAVIDEGRGGMGKAWRAALNACYTGRQGWQQAARGIFKSAHLPTVGDIAGANILCEGNVCVAVNRDLVVIVEADELPQAPVASKGGRLLGNSFHVAAIAEDAVPAEFHRVAADCDFAGRWLHT